MRVHLQERKTRTVAQSTSPGQLTKQLQAAVNSRIIYFAALLACIE